MFVERDPSGAGFNSVPDFLMVFTFRMTTAGRRSLEFQFRAEFSYGFQPSFFLVSVLEFSSH